MCYPFFQYYRDATFSKEFFQQQQQQQKYVKTNKWLVDTKFTSLTIQPYPGAPQSPAKGLKQDLVRMDDSFPCLDLLSFHEKFDTSTEFLMV